ncbi:MAG: sensor domain-containing diguanylate cyclase [Acidimicrobiia bacterium]|nr:sensor domain-containing diguanylate cyclase [Acidimicrobiia bacterium]
MAPDLDSRRRAARIAGALFLAGGLAAYVTLTALGRHTDPVGTATACGLAVLLGVTVPFLPWGRWPTWALLTLPLSAFGLLALGGRVSDDFGAAFAALLSLPFVFVGVTQRPGLSVLLSPVAVGAYLAAGTGGGSGAAFVVALPISVAIGEVLAQASLAERRAQRGVEQLLEASQALGRVSDEDEAAAVLTQLAAGLLAADRVAVMLAEASASPVHTNVGHRRIPIPLRSVRVDTRDQDTGTGVAVTTGRTVFVVDPSSSPLGVGFPLDGVRSIVFVPLPGEGGHLGVVVAMWSRRRRSFPPASRKVAELLAAEAGRAFERVRATARLAQEAETDALTNLANRRSYARALERVRPGDAVVLLDLDHFKRVNDDHGHAAGDQALRLLARQMRAVVRQGDCVARYGGDELAMILGGAGVDGAVRAVERLRESWRASAPATTFSAGIAVRRADEPPAATLGRADAALYRAKGGGRDRVELASGDPSRSSRVS